MSKKTLGFYSAISIVIANMIGTGVFTSLGFQLMGIQSAFAILLLWLIGGVIGLSGALSYGELAAAMPRSGGEYHYLTKIFHPVIGFLSGWTSATVGFAAPVALASMALEKYFQQVIPGLPPFIVAISVVALLTFLHSFDLGLGSRIQNIFTFLKVFLILIFIIMGFTVTPSHSINIFPEVSSDPMTDWSVIFSSSFAVSLVYVSYAFSGWNASAYIAGEIDNPQKNLPRSLFWGTLVVMCLYLLLNYVFLYTAPMNALSGQLEVGYISAEQIFGTQGGKIMAGVISLLLVSSVSSMILAGPRVSQAMGEDLPALTFLGRKNKKGTPANAIFIQSGITILLILTGSFEKVMTYVGFTLNLFTFLTVLGLFVLRFKHPEMKRPYRTFGYPITPIVFLSLSLWTLVFLVKERPVESLFGLITVMSGILIYFAGKEKTKSVRINKEIENSFEKDEATIGH